VLSDVLGNLQKIAKDALSLEDDVERDLNVQKMVTNKSAMCRESVAVSTELFSLLQSCQNGGPEPSKKETSFMNLLANDCALWAPKYPSTSYLIPSLHVLLQRGAHRGVTHELFGSLLRVRCARLLSQGNRSHTGNPA